jgi:hypothetical protein
MGSGDTDTRASSIKRYEIKGKGGQMRNKAKIFLLSSLAALLVVPLLGCGFIGKLTHPSALSREQAIAIILVAGTPYIDDYIVDALGEEEAQSYGKIGTVTPTGDWDASYADGEWEIQGPVITKNWGECLTTWKLSEKDSKIRLVGFSCD